jgi:general secretion pathway protein D
MTVCSWPIVLHDITIENATFDETVQYIRWKTRQNDLTERDPAKRGINIVIKPPLSPIARFGRITLRAKEIKLTDLVNLVGKAFQMRVSSEPFAVVFRAGGDEMFTRSYSVPPIFRSISTK